MYAKPFAACIVTLLIVAGCQQSTVRGPQGKEMTLTVPRTVTLDRGSSQTVEIAIDRKGFHDPVDVTLGQLPYGVEAERVSQRVDSNTARFVLRASPNADRVQDHRVAVTVSGPDGIQAAKHFRLNVRQDRGS